MSMSLGNRDAQQRLAQVPSINMPRSVFDRSRNVKDTMGVDYLRPIYLDEILPGDTVNLNLTSFIRLPSMLWPVMDNMYMDYFFFFVPNRLIWSNWEKFCGAQDNPGDSISYTIPTVSVSTFTAESNNITSLASPFGLPFNAGTQVVNALPFRAYNLIWNTWFRAEDIQNSLTVATDNGPDNPANYQVQYRGKRHDYFTSCQPWPQKGTALNILPADAPVALVPYTTNNNAMIFRKRLDDTTATSASVNSDGSGALTNNPSTYGATIDPNGRLAVTASTAGTIAQLRQAFQIQEFLERDSRGGTRYVELLLSHFGVVSPDFRLQRPEYLGGGEVRFNSHVVPQTSPTSGSNYKGDLGAFGTGATQRPVGFTKSFVEHGYLIGLASIRGDITYQSGVEKLWQRSTRYDFFWPEFANLGEQAVLNREIYADGSGNDALVFGYQERHAEYRYAQSQVRGVFSSFAGSTLDVWHLAQKFLSLPLLNSSFIGSFTTVRWMANASTVPCLHDMFFTVRHARAMPSYSVPASLRRF